MRQLRPVAAQYPQAHSCTFDLKRLHMNKLKKENPKFEDERMGDKA
jgi:hypothetical protein